MALLIARMALWSSGELGLSLRMSMMNASIRIIAFRSTMDDLSSPLNLRLFGLKFS